MSARAAGGAVDAGRERATAGPGLALAAIPAALVAAASAYWFLVRPWHLRWGATDGEADGAWPGDQLLPRVMSETTHGITIARPAAAVWPWIAQIGQDRGGFYSYTWIENLLGCRIESADHVMAEHQDLQVGDLIRLHPGAPPLSVAIVDPGRVLVLAATAALEGFQVVSGTWAFFLRDLEGGATRLVVRTRWSWAPGLLRWAGHRFGLEPAHFVMERRMLLGVKQRAETAAPPGPPG